ncbi:MAG: M23 family metallopeptidase, partial [Cutibacterium avidum]|nr:M23 family metallopeptidase [Cutibacterium avidum]
MVSRSKAIKTVIAGGVGVAVVGLSVDAAWPSDPGLRAVPDHQQLVSRPMSTAWPASWLDTTPPTPNITQSSAPVSPGVLAPVKAATPTPSPAVSKVAMPTGVLLSKPLNGPVTSPFGMRFHPILHVWKLHTGVDFGASCGTPVGSSAPGKVLFAGPAGGYGNRVEVDHGNGLSTRYGHLSEINVKIGQQVKIGDIIGEVGSTGRSTGPHLHY